MDTRTVEKIIAMLDAKIWNLTYEHTDLHLFMIAHEYSASDIKEAGKLFKAEKQTLVDFKEHLRKLTVIHNDLYHDNHDMYNVMDEISEQQRLQADEESRLGEEG